MTTYCVAWNSLSSGKRIQGQTRYATRAEAQEAADFMNEHFASVKIKHDVEAVAEPEPESNEELRQVTA